MIFLSQSRTTSNQERGRKCPVGGLLLGSEASIWGETQGNLSYCWPRCPLSTPRGQRKRGSAVNAWWGPDRTEAGLVASPGDRGASRRTVSICSALEF
ncbi:hypothetical protein M406DRAFT_104728 [Cryphonectria parasitica EP155]|uniref:Uncharacterized protein n=1 Tax=Cryphonectria parasitica (strain ATCC 38755 / EP155) TaxID=660469 RepID=A0A9P4YA43_CRYP1|nr:uncharacterized protein M406DRAFT_104728 [Cryphonectria parasitica EP155]KAF3769286.1 hypothetical protein M406DRAFT_104728 [Cryphonectria parasitica EP155]